MQGWVARNEAAVDSLQVAELSRVTTAAKEKKTEMSTAELTQ
jgi:hypothetical protein